MKKKLAIVTLLAVLVMFLYIGNEMSKLPPTYNGSGEVIVNETEEKTGAINSVTATVFDFRGFDTLGESIVLLTAVCGTTAVLRKNRGGKKHEEQKM